MSKKEKVFYVCIDEQLIEVSEEIYHTYYRPIWRTRYRAQKNGECRCTKDKIYKCDGICAGCPYHTENKVVSLDKHVAGENEKITLGNTIAADADTPESISVDKMLLDALYEELDRLDPEGRRICELLMHHSERESADIMGLPRSTFKRHWAKVKAILQDNLKEYYR